MTGLALAAAPRRGGAILTGASCSAGAALATWTGLAATTGFAASLPWARGRTGALAVTSPSISAIRTRPPEPAAPARPQAARPARTPRWCARPTRRGAKFCVQDAFHDAVARAGGAAAQDDADQRAAVLVHRGHQVEAGGVGVAGLDAVDAVDLAEQMVVIADDFAGVVEFVRREIMEILREFFLHGLRQDREVMRRGELLGVGQAGSVAVKRARHAEFVGLLGHFARRRRIRCRRGFPRS